MRSVLLLISLGILTGCASLPQSAPRHLESSPPPPAPLALDPDFSIRKTQLFFHDPRLDKATPSEMINFERERLGFGVTSGPEAKAKEGHYFTFYWRARRPAHLVVRLEYRQQNLQAYVRAQEVDVPRAIGSMQTRFQVTGDEYADNGRILAWRVLLLENGRIVAKAQSFLWH